MRSGIFNNPLFGINIDRLMDSQMALSFWSRELEERTSLESHRTQAKLFKRVISSKSKAPPMTNECLGAA